MDSKKVSIFQCAPLDSEKYMPMVQSLDEKGMLCRYYGIKYPRVKCKYSNNRSVLTLIPYVMRRAIIEPLIKLLRLPQYYGYWSEIKMLDYFFSFRIIRDESNIIFTSPLFLHTISMAKKMGKIVVVEAGNSEPQREYNRIIEEYKKYNIKHRYIYGDTIFKDTCLESFGLCDKIVTISKVSNETYLKAGFSKEKLNMIPLTGTDFPVQSDNLTFGQEKVFISTAYHNFIKGTHRLLLGWRKAKINNSKLLIVGRLCEDINEFIEKYGPFENVEFIGPRNDLRTWYSTHDAVGVLLSLSEGAVRVTPEMMSFGFPMIVSHDATCDLVIDGYNGYIIEPTNEDSIADILRWFSDDWERVHTMRKKVLDSVKKRTMKDWSLDVADFLSKYA